MENFDFDVPCSLFRVSVNDVLSIDLGGEFLRRNKFFSGMTKNLHGCNIS